MPTSATSRASSQATGDNVDRRACDRSSVSLAGMGSLIFNKRGGDWLILIKSGQYVRQNDFPDDSIFVVSRTY